MTWARQLSVNLLCDDRSSGGPFATIFSTARCKELQSEEFAEPRLE